MDQGARGRGRSERTDRADPGRPADRLLHAGGLPRSRGALGRAADLGIRPSGGALRKQVAVLAHNLTSVDTVQFQHHDGYTVMPITVDRQSPQFHLPAASDL